VQHVHTVETWALRALPKAVQEAPANRIGLRVLIEDLETQRAASRRRNNLTTRILMPLTRQMNTVFPRPKYTHVKKQGSQQMANMNTPRLDTTRYEERLLTAS